MKKLSVMLVLLLAGLPALGQYVAQDPTRYIPNARVLGLGKAYIGLANDSGALYTNPAGLMDAENWQLTSMSGKFLDEYSYLSFSGFYPTEYGTIGMGFAGTSITGAFATTIETSSDPSDPIYTIDPTQPQMGNYNNAFILSYANQLEKINYLRQLPLAERLALGVNLKLFNSKLYGDGIVGGEAAGYELDLGLKLHPPQSWMAFGLTVQNLLPGGKLKYVSGHEESYPAVVEGGSVFNILGKEKALYRLEEQELRFMLDFDYHPTLKNYPLVWHAGAEWKPLPAVALRGGIDQDTAGDGRGGLQTVSDLAGGVGLYLGGLRFDYAYHTFAGAPNIDNHYFSLSYGLVPRPKEAFAEPIAVEAPADQLITFEAQTKIEGRVLDSAIRRLTLDGAALKFTLRGFFSAIADLKIGKNAVTLTGKNESGEKIAEKKLRILRLYTYPDVPAGYWCAAPISLLAMADVITGYPDGSFKPGGKITRAEICALLMRTKGVEKKKVTFTGFSDVKGDNWAANFILEAARSGAVTGYPDGTFKPGRSISRAEGLAMIGRFTEISEEIYEQQFPDVFGRHWAAGIIAGAHKAGVLEYLKGKNFEPNKPLTRAETVEILQRTAYIQSLLKKDLLNWESY